MKLKFYELEGNEPEILLRALLSGLRPDGVRLILRKYIEMWVKQYEKAGAGIQIYAKLEDSPENHIRILCYNHGNLDRQDLDRLDTLEDLYNTINEWGIE